MSDPDLGLGEAPRRDTGRPPAWSSGSAFERLDDEAQDGPASTRLLLVEDNPGDAELIEELLHHDFSRRHFEIERARDLREAITALPGAYDLILVDLRLPDGHGLAAFEQVAQAAGTIPTVVLTGLEDAELARACLEAGAEDYLSKGELTARNLLRAVDYALARSKARDLHRRLEHSNRLAAVGQLAAGVAHEVNNPAAFILANTHELLRGVDDLRALLPEAAVAEETRAGIVLAELEGMLRDNLGGIERIVELVRDLGAFSRTEADDTRRIDVAELCRTSVNLVAHQVRHRARLELDLTSVPPVLADPRKLGQVVVNLVINAAHAIESGTHADNVVRVETAVRDDLVVIAVSDTGCGIAPDVLDHIFTPFFSTKPRGEGTGLGLSICAEIVERLGGRITVESTEGEGSRFEVLLPAATGAAQRTPRSHEETGEQRQRRRVLLVDDEQALLRAVGRGLRRHHEVVEAANGAEALRILADDQGFDAILCDLMMPEVDGVEVVERLRARLPALAARVVLLSGGAVTSRASEFLAEAGLPVLYKPVGMRALLDAIETAAEV